MNYICVRYLQYIVNIFKLTLSHEASRIGQTVTKIEETIKEIDDTMTRSNALAEQIEDYLKTTDEIRTSVKQHFEQLNTLQCTLQYLRVLHHIEKLRLSTCIMFSLLLL